MKKRILSIIAGSVLSLTAIAGFAGCGDDGIKLKVWASAAQEETLTQMVEKFKAANPDKKYKIEIGIGEEDMAYSNVSKDPTAAADVYSYSNDQLIPLLRIGALAELGGTFLDSVKKDNSAESVASGSVYYGTDKEKVYGYPYASDNGYFMFYDKSVVSDEDVAKLETIISKCEAAGKKIGWAIDVPWYTAGWFFSFGCSYSVEYDEKYVEKNVEVDFNSENGIKASKAIAKLTSSKSFSGIGTDDNIIVTGFTTHTMAVAVSGTWNANTIKAALDNNYGVCKLPTVNVDGNDVQLASFKGYKLFGVNPHSGENLVEAHRLAAFLSSEAMQQERFEKHLIGPTNNVVAELDAVKNDPTFAALSAQNAFAVDQTSVPSNFWEPLKNYGLNIIDDLVDENGTGGRLTYMEQLNKMVSQIKSTASAS